MKREILIKEAKKVVASYETKAEHARLVYMKATGKLDTPNDQEALPEVQAAWVAASAVAAVLAALLGESYEKIESEISIPD